MFKVIVSKSSRFLAKQADDIAKYGRKDVSRSNVSDDILDCFTPFRRTSQRPCSLSEPKHFISKFEATQGNEFLPINWSKMTEAQKVDYIVHDRYSKLVSHKIMDKIKSEPIEHGFALNPSGDIVHYSGGNSSHCLIRTPENGISIHNHPGSISGLLDEDEIDLIRRYKPASLSPVPQGGEDLMEGFKMGERAGYVVDSLGNKFVVEPSARIQEMGILDRIRHISKLSDGMNKADIGIMEGFNKKAINQAAKVDDIYEEAMKYAELKGTPQFDEAKWLQYRVDFAEAKYNQRYPYLGWREDLLKEASNFFGFKFSKI